MVGVSRKPLLTWYWNLPELPPLQKICHFVEDTIVRRVPLQRWQGRYLVPRSTIRRYFAAARWVGLVDGDVRYPGGWDKGLNLLHIRDSDGIYHAAKFAPLVESNDLFHYAFKLVNDYNNGVPHFQKLQTVRDEMAYYMSTVRTRGDGRELAEKSLRSYSCQIINWTLDILGEQKFEIHL